MDAQNPYDRGRAPVGQEGHNDARGRMNASQPEEKNITAAADDFVKGEDPMQAYRQIYAASAMDDPVARRIIGACAEAGNRPACCLRCR